MNHYLASFEEYKLEIKKYNEDPGSIPKPKNPSRDYLYLAANITKSALLHELSELNGFGLLFASEADTLFTANKGEHGRFTDLMRTAFHGEPYLFNRKEFDSIPQEIASVRFGMLLTSTLDQCFRLIPTYEDGLFSRFIFYLLSTNNKYKGEDINSDPSLLDQKINEITEHYYKIGMSEKEKDNSVFFAFSNEQKKARDDFFSQIDEKLTEIHSERIKGNVFRASLIFTRICMLLSYLRSWEENGITINNIYCNEIDFNTAQKMTAKLLNHLQILDSLYESKNPRQRGIAHMPLSTNYSDEIKKEEKKALTRKAIEAVNSGHSYREVSRKIYGKEGHEGTIHKWVAKYKREGLSFPFPETETPEGNQEIINTQEALQNAIVSVFKNVRISTVLSNEYDLFELLTSDAYKTEVAKCRRTENKARRDEEKKKLPAFTVSGCFNEKRSRNTLLNHSGFICVDIDEAGNENIANFEQLKRELSNIVNIAYCGHSVSGRGYFALIPISEVDKHEYYFEEIEKAFFSLGIQIDKACKDVSRLRIISYNDSPYISSTTVKVNLSSQQKGLELITLKPILSRERLEQLVEEITEKKIDITQKYPQWFGIACGIANEFGESGRIYFHKISKFNRGYNKEEANKLYSACLNPRHKTTSHGYSLGTVFYHAKEAGLTAAM